MEDVWLESVEGICVDQSMQGVVLFPLSVIIQFLEVGEVFSQVSNSFMYVSEALYFSVQGLILLLPDSEIDHGDEHLPREEGISLFACEDLARV
jgi:hypothetical protein